MTDPLVTVQYNDAEVQRLLSRAILRLRDLSIPMREIGELHLLSTDERFENEVDPFGRPWKDIKPRTRAIKRAKGRIDKILQGTGAGRNSVNYRATKFSVSTGTPVKYMADHQRGTGGQDKREFLGSSDEDREETIAILRDWTFG